MPLVSTTESLEALEKVGSSVRQPKWDLAYLFAAHFEDGSQILQTPGDESALEPGVRSAYYDVERRVESGVNLTSFALYNDQQIFSVDLRDGHFEFKSMLPTGASWWRRGNRRWRLHTTAFHAFPLDAPMLPPGGTFKLIYFRDHQQDIISTAGQKDRMGEHRIWYRIGWKYDVMERGELKTYSQSIVVV